MGNNFKTVLVILISIIFLVMVVLFAYRQELWGVLTERAEIGGEQEAYVPQINVSDTLDLELLKSPVLDTLEKKVINFDYENVCFRPAITIDTVDGPVTRRAAACAVGNRLPFVVEKDN